MAFRARGHALTVSRYVHGPRPSDPGVGQARNGAGASERDRGRAAARTDRPAAPSGRLGAAGRAGRPDGPVAAAGPGRHRVRGRGDLPVGRAPGVGAPAARHPAAAVPGLLLRGAGPLPAHRRAGRQRRRPDRSADLVPDLHAGGDRHAVVHRRPTVRTPGRVLRGGAVRGARPDVASGRLRHLRCDVDFPGHAGRVAGGPGRPAAGRDRLDDRRRSRAGAGRRDRIHLCPVRRGRAAARAGRRVPAAGRQARRRAPADHPDRAGRPAHPGRADRRQPLHARDRAHHDLPHRRRGLPAHRAHPVLVVDRHHRHRRRLSAPCSAG